MTHATMTRRALAALALLLLAGVSVRTDAATRPRRATHARTSRTDSTAAARPKPAAGVASMPRTLEDVHIEGEIPVPQVLFITAREQRRFMDFQHHRFMRTSTQLGEQTPYPTWIAVIHDQPIDGRKETSR